MDNFFVFALYLKYKKRRWCFCFMHTIYVYYILNLKLILQKEFPVLL